MKHLFRQNGNQTAAIEIQFEQVNHARLSTLERGLAAEAVRGAQGGSDATPSEEHVAPGIKHNGEVCHSGI